MYIGLHVKYSLFLSDFNKTNFFDRFSKNTQILNVMKTGSVGAELFQVDGWTETRTDGQIDMTKLIIALHSCAKTPDKCAQRRHCSMNDILHEM